MKTNQTKLPLRLNSFAILFILFCGINFSVNATNYFSKSTGNLEVLSNWGTASDGTGTAPSNFTTSGDVFTIQNRANATIGANWTISGGATIVVGDGTNACNFTIPSPFTVSCAGTIALNGTITVASGGTLSVTGNSTLTGAINVSGTVIINDNPTFTRTGSQTYNSGSTLKYSGSVARTLGVTTLEFPINGSSNLHVQSGMTVVYDNPAVSHNSNTEIDGTVEVNKNSNFGNGKGVIVGTTGVLRMHTFQYTNSSANSFLTVSSGGTVETENATGFINPLNSGGKSFTGFSTLTLNAGSIIKYNASGAQNIDADAALPSSQKYSKLTIAGSGTKSLTGLTTVTNTLDLENSTTLSTGGNLLIPSGARVDQLDGTISGNTTVEQLIPGARKYRLMSHPFNSPQSLEQLTDNIDITGNTTGVTNSSAKTIGTGPFTATTTNNPSAYRFTTANADGGTIDAGWGAFTSASSTDWGVARGIRVLVRGTKGTGLDGNAYTPAAVTINMLGALNDGNSVTTSLPTGGTGATSGMTLVGNPYASPVDISAVIFASSGVADIQKTIYLRNGSAGSWISNTVSSGVAYNIPSYAGVLIRNIGASSVSLPFTEARKATSSGLTVFKKGTEENAIKMNFNIGGELFDNMSIFFDDSKTLAFDDGFDAIKLGNDSFNFNAITTDQKNVCADFRPLTSQTMVPLFTNIRSGAAKVEMELTHYSVDKAYDMYLHDNMLNTEVLITPSFKHTFDIDAANAQTFGANRFYILAKKSATGLNSANLASYNFTLYPNPASESINLSLITAQNGVYTYSIYNQLGEEVMLGNFDFGKQRNLAINIEGLSNGVYFVKLNSSTSTETIKFIK